MSISISEGQARLIYLDYHTRDNSMGTSVQTMGAIAAKFADKIHTWQASVDTNKYEWDDSDYEQYIDDGWEMGEEATGGHTRKDQAGDVAASTGHLIGAAGGAAAAVAKGGIIEAGKNVGNIISKVTGKKVAEEAGKKAAETATKETTKKLPFSAYIGAIIAIATYAAYLIKKPNKEGAKACEEMTTELANAQGALQNSQAEVENTRNNMIKLSDDASTRTDNTNNQIIGKNNEQDYFERIYWNIKKKIDSGKKLTKDEQNLYKLAASKINNSIANIKQLKEENKLVITDIYNDMDSYQERYDYAAETIGEAQGLAEYSASFDQQTKDLSNVEGIAMSLNAFSGVASGARLLVGPWWNWIIGFASMAAGVASGFAAKEQFSFASTAGNTIATREATEGIKDATQEIYDVEIDNYAALMGGFESMEILVPKDLSFVDDTLPANNTVKPQKDNDKPKKISEKQ